MKRDLCEEVFTWWKISLLTIGHVSKLQSKKDMFLYNELCILKNGKKNGIKFKNI